MQLIRAGQSLELEVEGLEPLVEVLPLQDPNAPPPPPVDPFAPKPPPPEPEKIRAVVLEANSGEYILSLGSDVRPRGLQPGARVQVRHITTLGLHNGRSVVVQVDRTGGDNGITFIISELTDLVTVQRRKHYRVGAVLPIELAVLESEDKNLADAEDRAMTLNISGGGLLIETSLRLGLGDRVRVTLRVPKDLRHDLPALLICQGHVLRLEVVTFDQFRVALQSAFEREANRDHWVQLTLNLQFGRA